MVFVHHIYEKQDCQNDISNSSKNEHYSLYLFVPFKL